MATKSFLSREEVEQARSQFLPRPIRGSSLQLGQKTLGKDLSLWLGDRLLERLMLVPDFMSAQPVILGSWARGELCPKSDIDIVFCGPEEKVQKTVGELQSRGIKIRSRIPEDPEDWTVGVEAFDVLAILNGVALEPRVDALLQQQKLKIEKKGVAFRKRLLQAIQLEKKARRERFDSVANYLEPNIKYGPGGLRDLEQALIIRELFSDVFVPQDRCQKTLEKYKEHWLAIRQRLHLEGGGDLISGNDQLTLAKDFGFSELAEFMRWFQQGISEVNFYADWVIEMAFSEPTRRKSVERRKLSTIEDALIALRKDPSVLMQCRILEGRERLKSSADLKEHFVIKQSEDWFRALFSSRLIDFWLKDVARLRGYVQHDHYHRFTADAHLLQAICLVARAKRKSNLLGKLQPWSKSFRPDDWQILLWTALFHDLAKGSGGDHSGKGGKIAERELSKWKVRSDIKEEVIWMVENHLLLSTAAFRRNVQDPATWLELHKAGAIGARLARLAVFTAIDIKATNPEAWNEWKERLLADLLNSLESATATGFFSLLATVPRGLDPTLLTHVDSAVVKALPPKKLMLDIQRALRAKRPLAPLVVKNRRGELWIRFHHHQDQPGLFLQFVAKLFALGCSVQQSSVRTLPKLGVYDWFQIRSHKSPAQIRKQLELIRNATQVEPPQVKLQQIEVVKNDESELILSFRGRDQKGVLLATARALYDLGFTIRWAKVVTWGSQIDDVFSVVGPIDISKSLQDLKSRFQVPDEALSQQIVT